LIEPQDQRLLSLVQLQTDERLDSAVAQLRMTAATARQNAAAVRKAITEFRAGHRPGTSGMLPDVANLIAPILLSPANAAYVRSDDAVYPPARAADLAPGTRVLVTDGTADTNVPPNTIGPLATALSHSGATGPGLRLLPDVDHFLHLPGMQTGDAVLAPPLIAALQAWVKPYALIPAS
jgi:hypothetical protein